MNAPTPGFDVPRLPEQEPLAPGALFPRAPTRCELEVGFGRGGFLLERAAVASEVALVGFEWRRKLVARVCDRVRRAGLGERVSVYCEDARLILARFAEASFDAAYLHFPDPWWKARHHKRRLATSTMLLALSRILKPGGELFIQSDVQSQVDAYERLALAVQTLEAHGEQGARLGDNPYGARSPRERRAMADGLPIYRLRFRKRTGETSSVAATPERTS